MLSLKPCKIENLKKILSQSTCYPNVVIFMGVTISHPIASIMTLDQLLIRLLGTNTTYLAPQASTDWPFLVSISSCVTTAHPSSQQLFRDHSTIQQFNTANHSSPQLSISYHKYIQLQLTTVHHIPLQCTTVHHTLPQLSIVPNS